MCKKKNHLKSSYDKNIVTRAGVKEIKQIKNIEILLEDKSELQNKKEIICIE